MYKHERRRCAAIQCALVSSAAFYKQGRGCARDAAECKPFIVSRGFNALTYVRAQIYYLQILTKPLIKLMRRQSFAKQ